MALKEWIFKRRYWNLLIFQALDFVLCVCPLKKEWIKKITLMHNVFDLFKLLNKIYCITNLI